MTSSLLLLTIAAVILAYVVSIDNKKYIYISLTIGVIVAAIAINMFYTGTIHLRAAEQMVQMTMFY